jgi:chemotaxis protein methyltransferase CheR
MSAISTTDFDFVSTLVYSHSAIVLERGKEYLVESRLGSLAEREGFKSLPALIDALRKDRSRGPLQAKAVDAMTTNETYFFRDFHPFEALKRHILPALIGERRSTRRLGIWSGACSTGQEPYTIAMILREHFPELASWRIDIVGTDISPTVLARAKSGIYSQTEINRGLPAALLIKYFDKKGDAWQIKSEIRNMVDFRPLNLIAPWPILPPLDLVFLRNVMIYFDVETKKTILKKIRGCVLPHASLFLGTAETTLNLDTAWNSKQHGSATVFALRSAA